MQRTKDAESLAIDILTFLTGISSRDGEKFPVLRRAVRTVTQSEQRGLLRVIGTLHNHIWVKQPLILFFTGKVYDFDFMCNIG